MFSSLSPEEELDVFERSNQRLASRLKETQSLSSLRPTLNIPHSEQQRDFHWRLQDLPGDKHSPEMGSMVARLRLRLAEAAQKRRFFRNTTKSGALVRLDGIEGINVSCENRYNIAAENRDHSVCTHDDYQGAEVDDSDEDVSRFLERDVNETSKGEQFYAIYLDYDVSEDDEIELLDELEQTDIPKFVKGFMVPRIREELSDRANSHLSQAEELPETRSGIFDFDQVG